MSPAFIQIRRAQRLVDLLVESSRYFGSHRWEGLDVIDQSGSLLVLAGSLAGSADGSPDGTRLEELFPGLREDERSNGAGLPEFGADCRVNLVKWLLGWPPRRFPHQHKTDLLLAVREEQEDVIGLIVRCCHGDARMSQKSVRLDGDEWYRLLQVLPSSAGRIYRELSGDAPGVKIFRSLGKSRQHWISAFWRLKVEELPGASTLDWFPRKHQGLQLIDVARRDADWVMVVRQLDDPGFLSIPSYLQLDGTRVGEVLETDVAARDDPPRLAPLLVPPLAGTPARTSSIGAELFFFDLYGELGKRRVPPTLAYFVEQTAGVTDARSWIGWRRQTVATQFPDQFFLVRELVPDTPDIPQLPGMRRFVCDSSCWEANLPLFVPDRYALHPGPSTTDESGEFRRTILKKYKDLLAAHCPLEGLAREDDELCLWIAVQDADSLQALFRAVGPLRPLEQALPQLLAIDADPGVIPTENTGPSISNLLDKDWRGPASKELDGLFEEDARTLDHAVAEAMEAVQLSAQVLDRVHARAGKARTTATRLEDLLGAVSQTWDSFVRQVFSLERDATAGKVPEIARAEEHAAQLEQASDRHEQTAQDLVDQWRGLRNKLRAAQKRLHRLQSQIAEYPGLITPILEESETNVRQGAEEYERTLVALQEAEERLRSDVSSLTEKRNSLAARRAKYDRAAADVTEHDARIEEQEAQLRQDQVALDTEAEENQRREANLEIQRNEAEKKKRKLVALAANLAEQESVVDREQAALELEKRKIEAEIEAERQRLRGARELDRLEAENARLRESIGQGQQQARSTDELLSRERDSLRTHLDEQKKIVKRLARKLSTTSKNLRLVDQARELLTRVTSEEHTRQRPSLREKLARVMRWPRDLTRR